ncbi:hypothetical protein BH10ACT9_BH10ACT9_28740 [soil metagenome]
MWGVVGHPSTGMPRFIRVQVLVDGAHTTKTDPESTGSVFVRDVPDYLDRTELRPPTFSQISRTTTAPMTEPMIPDGWKNPAAASLWKMR